VANPIALFDKTGACLYQNPESMTLHANLRPFTGLHTPTESELSAASSVSSSPDRVPGHCSDSGPAANLSPAQGAKSIPPPGADSVSGNAEHLQAERDAPNQGRDLLLKAIFRGNMPLYKEMLRVTLEGRERHICEVKSVDNIVQNMLT
jgi:hypothetical protein